MRLAAYYFKMSVKWCISKVLFTMKTKFIRGGTVSIHSVLIGTQFLLVEAFSC